MITVILQVLKPAIPLNYKGEIFSIIMDRMTYNLQLNVCFLIFIYTIFYLEQSGFKESDNNNQMGRINGSNSKQQKVV
jgi:hypothetical protein